MFFAPSSESPLIAVVFAVILIEMTLPSEVAQLEFVFEETGFSVVSSSLLSCTGCCKVSTILDQPLLQGFRRWSSSDQTNCIIWGWRRCHDCVNNTGRWLKNQDDLLVSLLYYLFISSYCCTCDGYNCSHYHQGIFVPPQRVNIM